MFYFCKKSNMFPISEQEKLNAYFDVYNNIKYNIAKKRRELKMTQEMTSILSEVSIPTLSRIEQFVSETQDIRLSSLIDICTLFKMSIQEVFEMRPPVDSEESEQMAKLLSKLSVCPSDLPAEHRNDFANYIGDDKFVDRNVFAAWHRILTLRNHGEPKPQLNAIMTMKVKTLEIGKTYKYNKKYHAQIYDLIKTLKPKEFTLRYLEPDFNICTRTR